VIAWCYAAAIVAEGYLMADSRNSSILASSLWMIVISLVLFFLPAVNGLIGGAVGGYKAGSAGRGVVAAILPAIVVGLSLWGLLASYGRPILGFFGGLAVGLWALISSVALLIGAAIGGVMAPDRNLAI
jgi:hypothetical protein